MAGLTDIEIGNYTKAYFVSGVLTTPPPTDPSSWTEIPAIQSLTHPTDEKNIIEVPQYGQIYPRKLSGSSSTGNAEIVVNFNPANSAHKALLTAYENGTRQWFRIEVNDSAGNNGSYFQFFGSVASKSSSGEFDSVVTVTFAIAVDGAIGPWTDNS